MSPEEDEANRKLRKGRVMSRKTETASLRERLEASEEERKRVQTIADAATDEVRHLTDENTALKSQIATFAKAMEDTSERLHFHEKQALKSLRINHGLIKIMNTVYDRDTMATQRKNMLIEKKRLAKEKDGPKPGDALIQSHKVGDTKWTVTVRKSDVAFVKKEES